MSLTYNEEERAESRTDGIPKKSKKKSYRLFDIDVHTVGIVDTPAVQRATFLVSKRADPEQAETPLTRWEIARQKIGIAHAARLEYLAGLSEDQLVEELAPLDRSSYLALLDELENYLRRRDLIVRLARMQQTELELFLEGLPPEQQDALLDELEGFLTISGQVA